MPDLHLYIFVTKFQPGSVVFFFLDCIKDLIHEGADAAIFNCINKYLIELFDDIRFPPIINETPELMVSGEEFTGEKIFGPVYEKIVHIKKYEPYLNYVEPLIFDEDLKFTTEELKILHKSMKKISDLIEKVNSLH